MTDKHDEHDSDGVRRKLQHGDSERADRDVILGGSGICDMCFALLRSDFRS